MNKARLNILPYTCRSIVDEDIELGAMIGYDGKRLLNYKQGMLRVAQATNSAKKGEYIEYTIKLNYII